jgi:hypothetical protein
MIAHTLLKQRVASGFANDQISPLDDDNRYEKGCVACVFQLLAVFVSLIIIVDIFKNSNLKDALLAGYPILSIGIWKIVDGFRIPFLADTEKIFWPEAVLSHNDKISKEASRCLYHTNLTVSHGNQSKSLKFTIFHV